MILQELIRNWILYREVLRPMLGSWKASIITGYYNEIISNPSVNLNIALNSSPIVNDGEEFGWDISDEQDAKSLYHISGTRTITDIRTVSLKENDTFNLGSSEFNQASVSRELFIVLADDQVLDRVVKKGKTYYQHSFLDTETIISSVTKTGNLTTGFESIQINFLLIHETHEKREYLGEFSLTHEETHLFSFKKGGGYHDTDQEPVAAII